MKHQALKKHVAYTRRNKELVAENESMKLKIRCLNRGYKRVVKKLFNLEDQNENVVAELEMAEVNLKELHKGYTNVCNANIAQGRETDNLRNELAKL